MAASPLSADYVALALILLGVGLLGLVVLMGKRSPQRLRTQLRQLIRPVGVSAVLGCSLLFILTAIVPIRAAGLTTSERLISLGTPDGLLPENSAPSQLEMRISSEGSVRLYPPQAILQGIRDRLPGVTLDGWLVDPDDPASLVSVEPGNELAVRGLFSDLDLVFTTGSDAASATVEIVGADLVEIDLEAPEDGSQVVHVSSAINRDVASTRFLWQNHTLHFSEPVTAVGSTRVGVLPVRFTTIENSEGGVLAVRVSAMDSLRAMGSSAIGVLSLCGVGVVIALFALLIGRGCEPRRLAGRQYRWIRTSAYGLAVFMLVVGAANYIIPVQWAIWVTIPFVAIGAYRVLGEFRDRDPGEAVDAEPTAGAVGPILAATLVLVYLGFWLMISGRWAVGNLQTDVFDYLNLTNLFWGDSARSASMDFGDGYRLLDTSARASVWGSVLERPTDAIIVLRLVFFALAAALSAGLVERMGYRTWTQVVVGVLVTLSSAFLSLFAEGYLSRTFFAVWLLIGLLAMMHQFTDGELGFGSWWCVGAISAVSLVVVPPFFLVVPALGGAVLLALTRRAWRRDLSSWKPAFTGFGLSLAVFGLPNMTWLRGAADTQSGIAFLNALVRNMVVPFYDTLRLPAAMAGLLPFHRQDGYRLGGAGFTWGPFAWSTEWLSGGLTVVLFLVILVSVLAFSLWSVGRAATSRAAWARAVVWLGILLSYLGGIAVLRWLFWNEQTYFIIMWIWSLAPVALAALIFLYLEGGLGNSRVRIASLATVIVLAATNAVSTVTESLLWTRDETSAQTLGHYGLAAPLERFARALEQGDIDFGSASFAVVVDQPSVLTGTDDDRVLTNVIANLLVAHGADCRGCLQDARADAVGSAPVDVAIVAVGAQDCGERETLFGDDLFVVCAPITEPIPRLDPSATAIETARTPGESTVTPNSGSCGGTVASDQSNTVLWVTDLYEPLNDPDDLYDVAVAFSSPQTTPDLVVLDDHLARQTGESRAVDQLSALAGSQAPDVILDTDLPEQVAWLERQPDDSVRVVSLGALTAISDLLTAAPDLMRSKVRDVLVVGGDSAPGAEVEYNVQQDPEAFLAVMTSGLPIMWVPAFDGGLWSAGTASYTVSTDGELTAGIDPEVVSLFAGSIGDRWGPRNLWAAALVTRDDPTGAEWQEVLVRFDRAGVVDDSGPSAAKVCRLVVRERAPFEQWMVSRTRQALAQLGGD